MKKPGAAQLAFALGVFCQICVNGGRHPGWQTSPASPIPAAWSSDGTDQDRLRPQPFGTKGRSFNLNGALTSQNG
jgi:hypothetical protein